MYKLIKANTDNKLEEKVNNALDNGFTLVGDTKILNNGPDKYVFFQAVIK